MKSAPHARTITTLFFLSGLSSLVLETVWVRQMVLVFGSTTFAVSTVLTAFMAGLALGSFLAGRFTDRLRNRPGRAVLVYAVLELGIGLYALAMPAMAGWLPDLHGLLWGGILHDSYHAFALARFMLAALLLALPTLAMGATLPVLAHYVTGGRRGPGVGKAVGTLYAVNTAGAVAGVFCAGFLLLPTLGLWVTNLSACLADLLLAGVALLLYRRVRDEASATPDPESAQESGQGGVVPLVARLTLASVAVSGALAMVNQVAWTRALSLIIGSSTYAFSLILLAFLSGLASGAAVYARRQAAGPNQVSNLAVIHLLTGVTCAFGPLLAMDRLPVIMLALLQQIPMSPPAVFLLKFTLAAVIILLPTFFMGMVFPAVIQIVAGGHRRGSGEVTGTVYAVNTLGAIVGSFAGGFLLIPLLGLRETLLLASGSIVLLGLLFGLATPRPRTRILFTVAALICLGGLTLAARPWNLELLTAGVFRVSRFADQDEERAMPGAGKGVPAASASEETRYLAWLEAARRRIPPERTPDSFTEPPSAYRVVRHAEGVTTTVSMTRSVDFALSAGACWVRSSLLVNGKPDASLSVLHARPERGCHTLVEDERPSSPALRLSPQGDTETQVLSGLLPYLLHPGKEPPRSALIIGWGSGVTVGAALTTPLASVTAAELEREVVTTARLFEPHNRTPQNDPRLTLLEADGRNLLASEERRHDIIISEPSNPWISGCGNLFTREFFELVRSRLAPDGVFLQWVQAYEISPENVWSILSTIRGVFPTVHLFSPSRAAADMLIVARSGDSGSSGKVPWGRVARRMAEAKVRKVLAPLGIHGPADLAVRLLAGPQGVEAVSRGAPVNTDDNARVEFSAPRDLINYKKFRARRITRDLEATTPDPLAALLSEIPGKGRTAFCRAALHTGRRHRMLPRTGPEEPELTRCRQAGEALARPLPPLDRTRIAQLLTGSGASTRVHQALSGPTTRASDRMAGLISPESSADLQFAGFAALGHLSALSGEHFDALAFLLAARQLEGDGLTPRYPLLSAVLAHQLNRCGLYLEALQILDLAD